MWVHAERDKCSSRAAESRVHSSQNQHASELRLMSVAIWVRALFLMEVLTCYFIKPVCCFDFDGGRDNTATVAINKRFIAL